MINDIENAEVVRAVRNTPEAAEETHRRDVELTRQTVAGARGLF